MIIILAILIILSLTISIFSFMQKGPIITTMYFLSNEDEKNRLKTKERYYFVGTTFLGVSILLGLSLLKETFNLPSTEKLTIIGAIILCIYVIFKYTRLESRRMRDKRR